MAAADPSPASPVDAERWRRPDAVELELAIQVGSRPGEAEDSGWEVWKGRIWALWDVEHWETGDGASDDPPLPPDHGAGWEGADLESDEYDKRLPVGHLERWLRPLEDDGTTLFDAADAIAADLIDVVGPVVGRGDDLSDDCYRLTGQSWLDRLLVLRSVELVPQLRGHGVGAWASARSIRLLARDSGTLIVTKAAPLHRDPFLGDPDGDRGRDFTPAEERAWRRAQQKIAAHWRSSLGLVPLPGDPAILVGTVDSADKALQAAVDAWA